MLSKIIEWTATTLIISAYLLNTLGYASNTSLYYLLMNICGACLLGFIVWKQKIYGALVIQIFWTIISLLGIYKYYL